MVHLLVEFPLMIIVNATAVARNPAPVASSNSKVDPDSNVSVPPPTESVNVK
jgi:hypothetical protein